MKPQHATINHPRGFSLVEVCVASSLMAILATLLASTWSGFGRPLVDSAIRARLAEEANFALASLAQDLSGSLSNGEGRIGRKMNYAFVGRMQPAGSQLWLCFDGGPHPNGTADWNAPDVVISYEVDGNSLIRFDQNAGTSFVVAKNVDSLVVTDLGGQCEIMLTFSYRSYSQTYFLVAQDP
jgi:prepilin-type N-terminal cleavage/methylation domain-containing protein